MEIKYHIMYHILAITTRYPSYCEVDVRTLHGTGAGLSLSKMTGVGLNFENSFQCCKGLDRTGTEWITVGKEPLHR